MKLCLILAIIVTGLFKDRISAEVPMRCSITAGAIVSRNGSSAEDNCENPLSSVLFDGIIPNLTVDGSNWANELLTISGATFVRLDSHFNPTPDNSRMGRVEITMFNCPQWGIGAEQITLSPINGPDQSFNFVELGMITSCDSLVKVCMTYFICNYTSVRLTFRNSSIVHLAEVAFYDGNYSTTVCPPETNIPAFTFPSETMALPTTHSTVANPTESTTDCTINAPLRSPSCSMSNILTSVITVIITAILTTAGNVLVHFAICKCHSKPMPGAAETPDGIAGEEYEQMNGAPAGGGDKDEYVEMSIAVNEPTYSEIGAGSIVKPKLNELYDNTETTS